MGQAAKLTRENRTITVDFHDETTYFGLLGSPHAFVESLLLDSGVLCPRVVREV